MTPLRIATRGSALARWQAEHVAALLSPCPTELVIIRTEGDRAPQASLQEIGGLGVFTKEVQHAVLRNDADLAVHSLKDLPTEPTPGLTLAAVPKRGPVADVFVSTRHDTLDSVPLGGRIATGSARRRALLRHRRPDLQMVDIRGNVDSRLKKLDEEQLDGLVLAEAGLQRLGLISSITERLDLRWMVPAVGQGALGIECRSNDDATIRLLQPLNDSASRAAVIAERAFLHALSGGCQVPIAALGQVHDRTLTLVGCVLSDDGKSRRDATVQGDADQAEMIGVRLAKQFS